MLIDNHGREINYVRLAVTDRCNLRCFYCMPHEGIDFLPKNQVLSFEEMLRLMTLLAEMGISKVRITGGEPFIRKDLMLFLEKLSKISGIEKIHITTNGVLTEPYLQDLWKLGIKDLNLSLDTLNKDKFFEMTRRDELEKVLSTFNKALDLGFNLKLNMVVMNGKNHEDILDMAALSEKENISVRFIEEMPFNGEGHRPDKPLNYRDILNIIERKYGSLLVLPTPSNSTSYNYQIPTFKGTLGIIAAYSRTFCGTCNRLRITPTGDLKICLYDDRSLNLKNLLRENHSDTSIKELINSIVQKRFKDGHEAEKNRSTALTESMTTIGG
jgi:molybdenum cofactor biosynthesis protein A